MLSHTRAVEAQLEAARDTAKNHRLEGERLEAQLEDAVTERDYWRQKNTNNRVELTEARAEIERLGEEPLRAEIEQLRKDKADLEYLLGNAIVRLQQLGDTEFSLKDDGEKPIGVE